MKKVRISICLTALTALLLGIVSVSCGKNPMLNLIGSSFKVGVGRMDNSLTAAAPGFKAHNSNDPAELIMTVTEINLVREDGSYAVLWSGTQDVDLSKITSLAQVTAFNGDIPPGKYIKFKLYSKSSRFKVKGSVVKNGITYYTKTAHTGYTTGPAEYEEIKITGWGDGGFSLERDFSPSIELGRSNSISEAYVLVDTAYYLTYYDGVSSTSGDWHPYGAAGEGMYLATPFTYAITIGKPINKEVYEYTSDTSTGSGRLVILYDINDEPVGASVRPLYVNDLGAAFDLYGWLADEYGSPLKNEFLLKNLDGSLRLQMKANSDAVIVFPNFQRSSHSGPYTKTPGGIGTYNAVRTQ